MDVYRTQRWLAFLTGIISYLNPNPVALTCKNHPTFRHCVLGHGLIGRREETLQELIYRSCIKVIMYRIYVSSWSLRTAALSSHLSLFPFLQLFLVPFPPSSYISDKDDSSTYIHFKLIKSPKPVLELLRILHRFHLTLKYIPRVEIYFLWTAVE